MGHSGRPLTQSREGMVRGSAADPAHTPLPSTASAAQAAGCPAVGTRLESGRGAEMSPGPRLPPGPPCEHSDRPPQGCPSLSTGQGCSHEAMHTGAGQGLMYLPDRECGLSCTTCLLKAPVSA